MRNALKAATAATLFAIAASVAACASNEGTTTTTLATTTTTDDSTGEVVGQTKTSVTSSVAPDGTVVSQQVSSSTAVNTSGN